MAHHQVSLAAIKIISVNFDCLRIIGVISSRYGLLVVGFSLQPCKLAIIEGGSELNVLTFPVNNTGLRFFLQQFH